MEAVWFFWWSNLIEWCISQIPSLLHFPCPNLTRMFCSIKANGQVWEFPKAFISRAVENYCWSCLVARGFGVRVLCFMPSWPGYQVRNVSRQKLYWDHADVRNIGIILHIRLQAHWLPLRREEVPLCSGFYDPLNFKPGYFRCCKIQLPQNWQTICFCDFSLWDQLHSVLPV